MPEQVTAGTTTAVTRATAMAKNGVRGATVTAVTTGASTAAVQRRGYAGYGYAGQLVPGSIGDSGLDEQSGYAGVRGSMSQRATSTKTCECGYGCDARNGGARGAAAVASEQVSRLGAGQRRWSVEDARNSSDDEGNDVGSNGRASGGSDPTGLLSKTPKRVTRLCQNKRWHK